MPQSVFNSNQMLVQGISPSELESMISQIIDKKLACVSKSIPEVPKYVEDGLYTRVEASEKLGISIARLSYLTQKGLINSCKIGSRIYYREKEVNSFILKYGTHGKAD